MRYLITGQSQLDYDNKEYQLISVKEALKKLNKESIWGVDTETFGFDPYTRDLFTVQIGNFKDQYCIDISTVSIKLFKDFFEDPNKLFIFHNAKFDLRFFYHQRIVIKNVYDTFLVEKLLWLGIPPGVHRMGLNDLCEENFGVTLDKGIRKGIGHSGLTTQVIIYACDDVKYLIALRELQLEKVRKENLVVAMNIENSFVRVLAYIEYSGMKLNISRWKDKMAKDLLSLKEAEKELNDWVLNHGDERFIYTELQGSLFEGFSKPKCNINWNSSKQVVPFLKSLGFNLVVFDKRTNKNKYSVEAPIIEKQKDISTITEPYLRYSTAQKVVSTYGQSFINSINPVSGKIHTQFDQLKDTTRLGSGGTDLDTGQKNINFQNIPGDKPTRSSFVPDKGNLFICADYSAQEDFVFTEISQEPQLIAFYNDKSRKRDGHSFVAKLVYKEELEGIDEIDVKKIRPDLRDISKRAKFAIHYGGNGSTVSKNLGLSIEEGNGFETTYFKAFPGISSYFRKVKKESWDQGYILISKYTGHKFYIHNWEYLKGAERRFNGDYWAEYREMKPLYNWTEEWGGIAPGARNNIILQFFKDFGNGMTLDQIASKEYTYIRRNKLGNVMESFKKRVSKACIMVECVKYYFNQKGMIERNALNAPVQGTAAQITKIAGIKYFEHLVKEDLLFKVWIPNTIHDEYIVEAPEEIAEQEAIILQKCMEDSGDMFCRSVKLKAVPQIGTCWLH